MIKEKKKLPNAALRILKALIHKIVKFIVAVRRDSQNPFRSVENKVRNTCGIFENIIKFANKEFVSRNDVFGVGALVSILETN
jgi:hypothetical protein